MEPTEVHPKCNRLPSARVTDTANDGELQLSSHRRARNAQHCDDTVLQGKTTKPSKRKHADASTSAKTSNPAVVGTSLADQVPQSGPDRDEGEYTVLNLFKIQLLISTL